ncbi:MAG: hypothetical protein E6H07_16020 [Bacteroidetes bacterium]|nr:MAG: hypothetical protein E6H07_16020 [Bacteroidota bacterium]
MKYLFAISFLLLNHFLWSQESKFKIISEVKISDSLTLRTGELMIFNNTSAPICLRVSTTFKAKILSRDTIRLSTGYSENDCFRYDLWVSQEDAERGFNDNPRYPLILYPRTCFVATISVLINLKCKDSWIDFSYLNQPDIDYNELLKKYEKHQVWDAGPKLKYKNGRVYFKSTINLKIKYD